MADNIKIIGEIEQTQQISRYSEADLNLLNPQLIKEDFGQQNDYIEYFVYDVVGNLLNTNYSYKDFKLDPISYLDPSSGSLPIIEINPVKDLQNLDYTSGEFTTQYNFFNKRISDSINEGLFIKEISADRTELRVGSTTLTNEQIENAALSLINEYTSSIYFVDYLLDFKDNQQAVAVNVALNKVESGYEILFKLYEPLSVNINEKDTLWVVKEKVSPYVFNINLDRLIIPAPPPQLRGPNFAIDIPNQNNVATSYQNYNTLLNSLNVSSSYKQLLSLITSQSIDINVDYSNFANFSFFGSAEQRVLNFYSKIQDIEAYSASIATYTPLTSSYPNLINDYNNATSSIGNIIANFDGFEYYLYFESGSVYSTDEYGITPYPKSTSTKPFTLYNSTSNSASLWLSYATEKAENYDNYNQNNLIFAVPGFIKDDENNEPYITFINMVGHYFDNIWIYLQAVTDINLANNNLEQGVSKDLVYTTLQSLGTKLYNKYGDSADDLFLIGKNSGNVEFDNNFTPTGSYLNNIPRKELLAETYKRIYHNLPLLLKTKGTTYGLQTLISTFGVTSSILNVKEYGGDTKSNLLNEYSDSKVRVVTNSIVTGSVLSSFVRLELQPTASSEFRTQDLHYVDISFSPETQIDKYTSASIATVNPSGWIIDDYIGDPAYLYSSSYDVLVTQKNTYYNRFTGSNMDYAGFIRLIQYFDNSLFKMLKDYVPARTNLSTGITINSPVLERNKWTYANPNATSNISSLDASLDGPTIGTEYNNLYNYLTGSKFAYYTGNITGSIIDYGSDWKNRNFNPYLLITASVDINKFIHSDFNILLNNISSSTLSNTRLLLQPIYTYSGNYLTLAGYSSSYYAELQDSNLSLTSYQKSRYEGVKVSSLLYNTYSSASATYTGDTSYGKTAAIDKNVRKIGLFTDIANSTFLPGRNRTALKYLVDEFGNLTELNQRNKNWEEIQRTFKAGEYLNVSQFDNQKSSNQKTTDGDKLIFESGYTYYPVLYFGTGSVDTQIYFENISGVPSAYSVTAFNGTAPLTISGSSNPGYPIVSNNIYNIFNTAPGNPSYFTPGTLSTFPTYSVQEPGNYSLEASFNVSANVIGANYVYLTGSLIVLKNGTEILRSTNNIDLVADPAINTASILGTTAYSYPNWPGGNLVGTPITTGRSLRIGSTSYPAGTTLYRFTTAIYSSSVISPPTCTVSGQFPTVYYSLGNNYAQTATSCTFPAIYAFNIAGGNNLYNIQNPEAPDLASDSATFSISRTSNNPISLNTGDQLSLIFNISSSTNNFTASLTQGNLSINSLAASTGYSSTSFPYFNTDALSASLVTTSSDDNSTIIFSSAISSFYNRNYQFIPNPLTGSQNSLYSTYGDVEYPFVVKPFDIVLTYLSDNTYVESRILSSSFSGSYLQLHLDTQLSNLYTTNLISGSYQRFLLLTRQEDETNAYLTFRKREGATSYGFVIPNNLSPDVLKNIDTITREVKQKLLADQSQVTINTF